MSKRLTVGRSKLATPIGRSKRRVAACLVERFVFVLGHETPLVRGDTIVVHSVGVLEEAVFLRVLLHISPTTALPAAWH